MIEIYYLFQTILGLFYILKQLRCWFSDYVLFYIIWCFKWMFFSKEINRQRNIKHLLLRKTDFLKTCRKSKFLGMKIWRNARALKSKRYKVYWGKRLFYHYCLQLPFVYKTVSQISFNLFCSGNKRLLSEFLRKMRLISWT